MTTIDTTHATGHSVEDFRERGFTHVPNLLTTEEVTRFRTAAEEALAAQSNTDEEFGTRIVATTDAWEHHPFLRELALHPRIGALAEQLAGMPLRVWGGEVLRKDPGHSAPTGWHDDLTFALLDSRLIFNAWIALVDVPAERGCLTFCPARTAAADRISSSWPNTSPIRTTTCSTTGPNCAGAHASPCRCGPATRPFTKLAWPTTPTPTPPTKPDCPFWSLSPTPTPPTGRYPATTHSTCKLANPSRTTATPEHPAATAPRDQRPTQAP